MKSPPESVEDAAYTSQVLPIIRAAGAEWVAEWRTQLAQEGRPMSGGWPGTLGEARAFVAGRLAQPLLDIGFSTATPEGLTRTARDLNEAARRQWRSNASADD